MTVDPAYTRSLSRSSNGRERYVDDEATKRIVSATGHPLRPQVCLESFSFWLNHIVTFAMFKRLSLPIEKRKFRELEEAFNTYERLSKELQTAEYFPPLTPRDWHAKTTKWFTDMNELYEKRSKGGRRSDEIVKYFYPQALGLFRAGFDIKPVSTTREKDTLTNGVTARFLTALFEEVEKSIDSFGFDDIYTEDVIPKLRKFRTTPSALRKNINKAMKILAPLHEPQSRTMAAEKTAGARRRPNWEIQAEFFEKFIIKR